MTRTLDTRQFRFWMLAVLLALGCIAAIPQARAQQMTSNFNEDVALIHGGIAATLAAVGKNDMAGARVGMEDLYRLWRQFRQKNIDGQPQNPLFAPTLLKTEERLYAASLQIDQEKLPAARTELEEASKLLNSLRTRAEPQ
jgi:hypothetical protein